MKLAVFRVEKTKDYTVMSNYHLKDRSLTLKSKGLLSMMLSLPDEWNYTSRGLAAICREGVDGIGSALKELEKAGYIVRTKLRDSKGRITDTLYVIYEQPHAQPDTEEPGTEEPHTEKPYTEKPYMEKPYMEKPYTEKPYMEKPYMEKPYTGQPCTENPAQLNTYRLNKDLSSIHPSINLSINPGKDSPLAMDRYRELVKENISYNILCRQLDNERLDEILELIVETLCDNRQHIRIGKKEYAAEIVKSRLLKLNKFHIEYVFTSMDNNTGKIHNIRNYLLTTLFSAPITLSNYYSAEANHDLHPGGFMTVDEGDLWEAKY